MRGKCFAAVIAGLVACGIATGADAERIHDKKIKEETKIEVKAEEITSGEKLSLKDRIQAILQSKDAKKTEDPKPPIKYAPDDIFGSAQATQEQCVKYLLESNPAPSLNCSAKEIVAYYYEEAGKEGIRPDVAFVQALKETGFFGYGGTVVPEQNNYCGLGTTSATVQGGYFESPQIGVRAHIQHLMAYSSVRAPKEKIVDPRYELVRDMYGDMVLTKWTDLNGRWAVPGTYYGQSILEMFEQLLTMPKA